MKLIKLNILSALLFLFVMMVSCGEGKQTENVVDQSLPKESAQRYLTAMFIENDLDVVKLFTHPDQKEDFSKSIGSLAKMMVRMESASFEITSFEQKENQALIKFNLNITSKGKTETYEELMTLEQVESKWYVK